MLHVIQTGVLVKVIFCESTRLRCDVTELGTKNPGISFEYNARTSDSGVLYVTAFVD